MGSFRRSAGKYGEDDDTCNIEKPEVGSRPAFSALEVVSDDDSDDTSDPILNQEVCPKAVEEMSFLSVSLEEEEEQGQEQEHDGDLSLDQTATIVGEEEQDDDSLDQLVNIGDWEAVILAATGRSSRNLLGSLFDPVETEPEREEIAESSTPKKKKKSTKKKKKKPKKKKASEAPSGDPNDPLKRKKKKKKKGSSNKPGQKKKGMVKRSRKVGSETPQVIFESVVKHFDDIPVGPIAIDDESCERARLGDSMSSIEILKSHFNDFTEADLHQRKEGSCSIPPPPVKEMPSFSSHRPSKKRRGDGTSTTSSEEPLQQLDMVEVSSSRKESKLSTWKSELLQATLAAISPRRETNKKRASSRIILKMWQTVNGNRGRS
jgi:hypothetical protein